MKTSLAYVLCSSLMAVNFSICADKAIAETVKTRHSASAPTAAARKQSAGNAQQDVLSATVEREFKLVSSDAITLDIAAAKDLSAAAKNDIDKKIRAKYIPVRISIINKSGKLLQIPSKDVYFVGSKGERISIPSEADIFKNVKRHGAVRALAWGVPLGVVSLGILAIPAFVGSGAHTKITNGTVKANIQENAFHGGHLSPEGSISTVLFIPKNAGGIRQVVLGRVINVEDEIETEKVIDINPEPTTEKKVIAKKS